MSARIRRAGEAPPYSPPLHKGVDARRLQGHEAGPTERFWVGLSVYEPGGVAETSPAAEETVYTVLDGEVVLTADDREETLRPLDSAHLSKGTVRNVENRGAEPATLLVVIATPRDST